MKKILACLMLLCSFVAHAQDDVLDEQRVDNGIRQIENSNYNYFTNEGWETTWGNLSSWYPDVLVNHPEAKRYIRDVINSRAVYDRFNDLNYRKKTKSIRYSDIDEFNRFVVEAIWREIDRLYPPVQ